MKSYDNRLKHIKLVFSVVKTRSFGKCLPRYKTEEIRTTETFKRHLMSTSKELTSDLLHPISSSSSATSESFDSFLVRKFLYVISKHSHGCSFVESEKIATGIRYLSC